MSRVPARPRVALAFAAGGNGRGGVGRRRGSRAAVRSGGGRGTWEREPRSRPGLPSSASPWSGGSPPPAGPRRSPPLLDGVSLVLAEVPRYARGRRRPGGWWRARRERGAVLVPLCGPGVEWPADAALRLRAGRRSWPGLDRGSGVAGRARRPRARRGSRRRRSGRRAPRPREETASIEEAVEVTPALGRAPSDASRLSAVMRAADRPERTLCCWCPDWPVVTARRQRPRSRGSAGRGRRDGGGFARVSWCALRPPRRGPRALPSDCAGGRRRPGARASSWSTPILRPKPARSRPSRARPR